jgi:MFS family permease
MNRQRLFVTSCISIGTAAMVFAIRGDIAGPMSGAFHITNEQMGVVFSPAFWAFTLAIVISGTLVDFIGMRVLHIGSALSFIGGVALILAAPQPEGPIPSVFDHAGATMLYAGFFLFGFSHGLVEGVINPLMASLYTKEKTKRITAVHAYWPAGMMIGGLLALGMAELQMSWQLRLSTILVPAVIYLFMALSTTYPPTERIVMRVSTGEMWKEAARPMFLLLFACMWLTAAVELAPDQWFPTVMGALVPQLSPEAGSGVAFLVYTAGLMFVLRMWGVSLTHRSPVGTLIGSSVLVAVGLYWLGGLGPDTSAFVALTAATVFGVGKTFLWPTMLGVTAELFPRGGALLLSLIGGAGMVSASVVIPIMGARMDALGPGAALQMMAGLGLVLAVVFTALWFYFRSKGGYRAVHVEPDGASR